MQAVIAGIAVHERDSEGYTALHHAVYNQLGKTVVALLATGADANVTELDNGCTSMWWAVMFSSAKILQLLIDSGASVNELMSDCFPLIGLASVHYGERVQKLGVLLLRPELDMDVQWQGITAEEWAEMSGCSEITTAIADERGRRRRWSVIRLAWTAATAKCGESALTSSRK